MRDEFFSFIFGPMNKMGWHWHSFPTTCCLMIGIHILRRDERVWWITFNDDYMGIYLLVLWFCLFNEDYRLNSNFMISLIKLYLPFHCGMLLHEFPLYLIYHRFSMKVTTSRRTKMRRSLFVTIKLIYLERKWKLKAFDYDSATNLWIAARSGLVMMMVILYVYL